ncbi:MAG: amidohydrolase family protein [Burkholderiaceae bacterium]|nr:amidohydrolase family protein [Burkholderiaceae bacterium]
MRTLVASAWFDGERYRATPVSIVVEGARIAAVVEGGQAIAGPATRCAFAMPGLVDAHCHLFLDGGELDFKVRSRYQEAPLEQMIEVGRDNVARTLSRGITLVRDAGDRYGVNHAIRSESKALEVRSAGEALRRPGRYGSFMAREVANDDEIRAAVRDIARSCDDLKIIETGIIDFESGSVKGAPQFDLESLRLVVRCAREQGIRTFAHCSGAEGIAVAVEAGIDSIEHGFFMTEDLLRRMAGQGTAWVPTFSPVHFQWLRPEAAGWGPETVLKLAAILESHREYVARAVQLGVDLVAGSDAGSPGVEHGAGLIDELRRLLECGLSMEQTLRAATSLPRRLWRAESADIRPGALANLTLFGADPFQDPANLLRVSEAVRGAGWSRASVSP